MSTKTYRDIRDDNLSISTTLKVPYLTPNGYPPQNAMMYYSTDDECMLFTEGAPRVDLVPLADLRVILSSSLVDSATQSSLVYQQKGSMVTLIVKAPLTTVDISQNIPLDNTVSTFILDTRWQMPCTIILPRGAFVLNSSHARVTFQWKNGLPEVIDENTGSNSGVPAALGPTWETVAPSASVGTAGQYYNVACAMSGDGMTMVIGDTLAAIGSAVGQARVFTRTAADATFTLSQTLVGTGVTLNSSQGAGVAISGDATTIAVAGPGNNSGVGAIWIYRRSTTTGLYNQQTMLVPSVSGVSSLGGTLTFPNCIALSSNGNVLVAGAPSAVTTAMGAVFLWNYTSLLWTETTCLTGGTNNYGIGPVAISADGSIFATVTTGPAVAVDNLYVCYNSTNTLPSPTGAIQSYTIATVNTTGSALPTSIAMSASGKRIAVGKPLYSGAATRGTVLLYDMSSFSLGGYAFVANSSTYSAAGVLGSLLGTGDQGEGTSVAMSGDGKTIIVGAPKMDSPATNCGNVFVWRDNNSVFNMGSPLASTAASAFVGTTVACDAGAYTVVSTPNISSGTASTLVWE